MGITMNILYYTWDEIIVTDMTETLEEQGHSVKVIHYDLKSYVNDAAFVMFVENELAAAHYDCIMTTNYFSVISKISLRNKIKYISWVFDSPCFTTYSEMIYNLYNYVFHFDSNEVRKLRAKGVQNIFHMPLAVNTKRVAEVVKAHKKNDYDGLEVSFLGNLYTDTNFFDMIAGVSDYHKGYINAAIDA